MELLNKIQKELKVPKNQWNAFASYHFRNAEDIVEAVKPMLGTATLIMTDEIVCVGNKNYVKATATLADGKESESANGFAREADEKKGMDVAQVTGAASSYARKYALNGLFAIDDTRDADSTDNSAKKVEPVKKPTEVEKKKGEIKKLCDTKALVPLLDKKDYGVYVEGVTGLKLEEGNLDAILEILRTI